MTAFWNFLRTFFKPGSRRPAAPRLGRFGLSKSKVAAFEQCPKRLWLEVHRPELGIVDADTKTRFAAGHEVGEIACQLYSDGIMIEAEPDIRAALERTAELLTLEPPRPLFEATFERDGVIVRVDLMIPAEDGSWHIAEVKSTTGAKQYQLSELATQIWVIEGSEIKIASASIRHIDREFLYMGEGDYRGLLKDSTQGEAIGPIVLTRAEVVSLARSTLEGPEPERETGPHCTDPFNCQFQDYCTRGRELPAWPISILPNTGARLAQKWAEQGVVELTALREDNLASALHRRILSATCTGEAFHDVDAARAATAHWQAPRAYLDFETIAFAVPRWRGTRPYEQVPFQFSMHLEDQLGGIVHREFLDLSGGDPSRACAEALVEAVPKDGVLIAYNASFERECLRRLAQLFPDLAPDLFSMANRLVDLLPVAKSCWYHPDQRGSWSIKAVLPTVAPELGYDNLAVADGSAAQLAYVEAINPATEEARRAELDQALRAYCERDTAAMVAVFRRLIGEEARPD